MNAKELYPDRDSWQFHGARPRAPAAGLVETVLDLSFDRGKADRVTFGALLESFVFAEVLKLMTASSLRLPSAASRSLGGRRAPADRSRGDERAFASVTGRASRHGHLSGLHEPIDEAIGLAFDRGIEHFD